MRRHFSMVSIPNSKVSLNTTAVATILMDIMKSHIGIFNGITGRALFKKVYGVFPENNAEDWFRYEVIKKAMHKLRVESNCFIVFNAQHKDEYLFFVAETQNDIVDYIDLLDANIKSMGIMKERARQSVKQKWYQNDFGFEKQKISNWGENMCNRNTARKVVTRILGKDIYDDSESETLLEED